MNPTPESNSPKHEVQILSEATIFKQRNKKRTTRAIPTASISGYIKIRHFDIYEKYKIKFKDIKSFSPKWRRRTK